MKNSLKIISVIFAFIIAVFSCACEIKPNDRLPETSSEISVSSSSFVEQESSSETEDGSDEIETIEYVVSPKNGEKVDFHTDKQREFFKGVSGGTATAENDYKVSDFARGVEELSRPQPVELCWSGEDGADGYFLEIALKDDFSNAKTYFVNGRSFKAYNLFSGTRYFWRVAPTAAKLKYSAVYNFETEKGVRNIFVDGITNVRDMGGYTTDSGKTIRQGLLYRGGRWNAAWSDSLIMEFKNDGQKTVVYDLAIKSEIDLRGQGENERGKMDDSVIDGIRYYYCGLMYSSGIVPEYYDTIRRIFEEILSNENNYPIYFHCSIGTDRTGMLAHLIGGLLGMEERDLQVDYLLSNFGNIGSSRSLESDMNNFSRYIKTKDGATYKDKVENFLKNEIGVSSFAIEKIRSILLEND